MQQLVGSYSKRHAITPVRKRTSRSHCMDAVGFRICFTPLTGVLFTVPSRYCALSVTTSSWPWTVVGPASHTITRVAWYSRWRSQGRPRVVRDYHPLRCAIPDASHTQPAAGDGLAEPSTGLTTPQTQRLPPWHACGLGISPVRSPLLRAVLYFLRVLRCFSSPGARSSKEEYRSSRDRWVAPFGNGGIGAWLRLPRPIAAVQRPSSARRAEASSNRASCLAWSPGSSAARTRAVLTYVPPTSR